MLKDSLVVPLLTAVNDVSQGEAKSEADQELGFNIFQSRAGFRMKSSFAQGDHFHEEILNSFRSLVFWPDQGCVVIVVESGDAVGQSDGRIDPDVTREMNQA